MSRERRAGFFILPCRKCSDKSECLLQDGCKRHYKTVWQDFVEGSRKYPLRSLAFIFTIITLLLGFYTLFISMPYHISAMMTTATITLFLWLFSRVLDE